MSNVKCSGEKLTGCPYFEECLQTRPVEKIGIFGDTQFCLALIRGIQDELGLEPEELSSETLLSFSKSLPEVIVCPKTGELV